MGERLISGRWVPAQLPEGTVDAILCHCADDETGHAPGSDECGEAPVKAGAYRGDWCSRDHHSLVHCSNCHSPVRGTCPECRKRVKVEKVETRGTWDQGCPRLPGESKAAWDRRRGPLLQVAPGMAPHKVKGEPCPGAGQPPAETRYTPGRELAAWTKAGHVVACPPARTPEFPTGSTTHHREKEINTMALQRARKTGGAFLDLKELAADGPVLAVFRVVEFQAAEKATGFEGVNLPVVADVLICSGPRSGEVHLGERFIGAITSTLRGVRNPKTNKGEQPQPPETAVGDEIVARIKVLNPGKSNAGAVGDEPSDAEMAAVEQVYDGGAAWAAGTSVAATPEPVGAGAGGGKSRPW